MKIHGRLGTTILLVAVLGIGLTLNGGVGVPPAGEAAGWTLPSGPVTLQYWDGGDSTKSNLIQTMLRQYEQLHPNVKIDFQTDVFSDKVAVALSAGTVATLFEAADWSFPKYIQAGLLDPLPPQAWGRQTTAQVLDAYIPHLLDAQYANGNLYGVPDQQNAHSLYINNLLFKAAGLDPVKDAPKTWADVAHLNTILTKRQGNQIVQKGFEMRYVCPDGHWVAQVFQILLYQAGGEMFQNGQPVFNSAAGVKALETWKSVTVAPQVTQNTCASPYQDFADGQDAMTFMGPNGGPSIELINPKLAGNYTVVPLPAIDPAHPATIVYSFNWTVYSKAPADQKMVAWDLVHYLSSQPLVWWTQIKFLQSRKAWYDTPEAKAAPFLGVFIHDLSVGRPVARTVNYPQLQPILGRMIDRVILSNQDPKQALDQAVSEYQQATK